MKIEESFNYLIFIADFFCLVPKCPSLASPKVITITLCVYYDLYT